MSTADTLAALRRMPVPELMAFFGGLDAPSITEMHGEYHAELLRQPSWAAALSGRLTVSNPLLPGVWRAKAFRPLDSSGGRGYNSFNRLGRTVRHFPMQTLIAPSRYDGRPAYTLVYRAFRSLCGDIHMVDEVRKVTDGVYLGIGTWGFTERQRRIPLPFLLTGPDAPYHGDIGEPRARFSLPREVPGLRRG